MGQNYQSEFSNSFQAWHERKCRIWAESESAKAMQQVEQGRAYMDAIKTHTVTKTTWGYCCGDFRSKPDEA